MKEVQSLQEERRVLWEELRRKEEDREKLTRLQTWKPITIVASTQTPPPLATWNATTEPALSPPSKTYAKAAVQATTTPAQRGKGKGKEKAGAAQPPPLLPRQQGGTTSPPKRSCMFTSGSPPPQVRTLVMHAAPLKFKPGTMRRWIEEDNKGMNILGIRWLLKEVQQGKAASSLVIYLKDAIHVGALRMGRRLFRTTCYDWNH